MCQAVEPSNSAREAGRVTERPGGRERRQAAIFMLDIVGFSRMMGQDEDEAASRVIRFHDGVSDLISGLGGRVIDTAGDSVFALFDSVVAAVDCAAEIQKRLAADPRPDRMVVRIGIHYDEVLLAGSRAFGEGVNIAARLEQVAPPGGIAVSEEARLEVADRFPFVDEGHRTLKNIAGHVRVFTVPGTEFGFPAQPVPRAMQPMGGFSDLAGSFASAVEERLLARGFSPDLPVNLSEPPPKPRHLVESRFFWFLLVIGVLLVAGHVSGWTRNGLYPLFGLVLIGAGLGRLGASITGLSGLRSLMVAAGLALGALFLDGTVSRAIAWAIAAALVGPGIAGLRRSQEPRAKNQEPRTLDS